MQHTRFPRIAGLVAGVAAVAIALTPSLVPRPALFQGFLAGLSFGLVYLAASWLWRAVSGFLVERKQLSAIRRRCRKRTLSCRKDLPRLGGNQYCLLARLRR